MPLTPAHTAAAWPLKRILPSLPLDALVLGTMVPDFQYFLELAPRGRFGHTPLGLLVFCLPVGLLTWSLYRHVVRPAGLTLVPPGLRATLVADPTSLVSVIVAILLGASSHVLWDSFTHARGWGVHAVPALSKVIHLDGLGDVAIYKILQHSSTILGIAVVTAWVWRWVRRQPPSARAYDGESASRTLRILSMLLGAIAGGAFLNGLRGIDRGLAAGLGHAAVGGMAALFIASLVFGLLARRWQGSGTAT